MLTLMVGRGRSDESLLALDVGTLRTILKGLECWRATYEDYNVASVTWEGHEYHILDIEHIYDVSQRELAPRQAQAIKYFLVGNLREVDVAEMMGIAPTNPIGMYATDGLKRLIEMIQDREMF
jgi:hypothetical protein